MLEERKKIALKFLSEGRNKKYIANFFGVHPSNITRLLNKNEREQKDNNNREEVITDNNTVTINTDK
jgi:transposase